MIEIEVTPTSLPPEFNQTKITPSEHGSFVVLNSENVSMHSFHKLADAAIWRDHFFFGYYSSCKIYKIES